MRGAERKSHCFKGLLKIYHFLEKRHTRKGIDSQSLVTMDIASFPESRRGSARVEMRWLYVRATPEVVRDMTPYPCTFLHDQKDIWTHGIGQNYQSVSLRLWRKKEREREAMTLKAPNTDPSFNLLLRVCLTSC